MTGGLANLSIKSQECRGFLGTAKGEAIQTVSSWIIKPASSSRKSSLIATGICAKLRFYSELGEKLAGDAVGIRLTRRGGNALTSREHHHTGGVLTIPNILLVGTKDKARRLRADL